LSFGSVRLERDQRSVAGDLVLYVPPSVESAPEAQRRADLLTQLRTGFRLEVGETTVVPEVQIRALGHGKEAVDVVQVRFELPQGSHPVRLTTSEAVGDVAVEWIDRATQFSERALVPAGNSSPWIDWTRQASVTFRSSRAPAATGTPAARPSSGREVSSRTLADYFRMGFSHIVPGGVDHLLFVSTLAMLVLRSRSLLLLVTAFTAGHAVSVTLASFGVATASSGWVEPAIALSLAYGALEWRRPKTAKLRPYVVVAFGLVHGLGFAGALSRVNVPPSERTAAIVGFNLGVEVGQILAAGVVSGLLFWLDRHFDGKQIRWRALWAIAAVGTVWAAARIIGFDL
jgi:hypothetical protein